MSGKQHVLALVSALAIVTVVGCGNGGTTSSPTAASPTSTPIASLPAVATVKEKATACVQKTGTSGLLTSSGRTELVNCLESIIPPAKQQAFKDCITGAAVDDQIWTSDGWTKFTNTSLPACLNQIA